MLGGTATAAALAALSLGAAVDRLDAPALRTHLAATSPLTAVASAGSVAVAVGPRGHVLRSQDAGATWVQASVPASADLTAVQLSGGGRGLAVGHDGLVLATEDGGRTWVRRLDGRGIAALLRARHPGCDGGPAGDAVRIACEQGAAVSLLDVWVGEDGRGLAVGAFALVLWTEDGGRTWTPWLDRTENPRALHLYAVRPVAGEVLVAGEQGLLLRLDRARGRLVRVPLRPGGSLFGLAARGRDVVAFGLGGRALRSGDGGATWSPAETGVDAALVGGAVLPDGRIVLVSQRGDVVASADGGRTFLPVARVPPAAAVAAAGADAVLVAGAAGVRRVPLR
jgi:photosystem II stability/assembly factor-like uncharacterized protein